MAALRALVCVGIILMLTGVAMGVDTSLAGAPPGAEERRVGRARLISGALLAGSAALVADLVRSGSPIPGGPTR